MEQRQTQIREGAGLEESRLNTEFIDFLKKFSTPILVVIAVAAGGYAGLNYLQKQRDIARDHAFVQLEAALGSHSPKSLVDVADDNASRGAVAPMARLSAADLHLGAARTGIRAGIQLKNDGALPEGEKYLTDEEKAGELGEAAAMYQLVADATDRDPARVLLNIGALNGLASVAEMREKYDDARAIYNKVLDKAKAAQFDGIVAATKKRVDTLDKLKTLPKLYALADLPNRASAAQSQTPEDRQIMKIQTDSSGNIISLEKDPSDPTRLKPIDPTAPATPDPAQFPPQTPLSPNPVPSAPANPGTAPAAPATAPATAPSPTPAIPPKSQ